MDEKAKNTEANRLTARQQRLLLRAVVGSLVLSAALASAASAQEAKADPAPRENTELTTTRFTAVDPRPFRELLAKAARLHSDGLISWDDTFEVTFEAERAPDGSLRNLNRTSVAAVNGRWPELMRELVATLGESRLLALLEDAERLSLTFRLDPRGAFAGISFEAQSPKRAEQLRAAYGMLLHLGAWTKRGRPEELIFRGAHVTANGKQLAMTLEMPREQLGNLLSTARAIP